MYISNIAHYREKQESGPIVFGKKPWSIISQLFMFHDQAHESDHEVFKTVAGRGGFDLARWSWKSHG